MYAIDFIRTCGMPFLHVQCASFGRAICLIRTCNIPHSHVQYAFFELDFGFMGVVFCSVCCSVLQCVTLCCSALQCITACCSALQLVAAYCFVLQRFTVDFFENALELAILPPICLSHVAHIMSPITHTNASCHTYK